MIGTSLVVQRLRLCAPSAGGPGSVLGQGTRPPHATTKSFHAMTERSSMLRLRLSTAK